MTASAAVCFGFAGAVVAAPQVDFRDFMFLLNEFLVGATILWLVVGTIAAFVLLAQGVRLGAQSPPPLTLFRSWAIERWNRDRFASLFGPPVLFAVLMAAYNAYKQRILVEFGFVYDRLFEQLDRLLFLGNDPWVVSHALFGSAASTNAIGHLYHGWYAPMSLGIMICAWLPATSWRLRTRYLFSYLAIWIVLGCGLATLLPAAGPVFVPILIEPHASFSAMSERLFEIDRTYPLTALRFQALLADGHAADGVRLAGGISAMPSVHNALAVLFAIIAFRVWRPAGWAMAAYAFAIWVGSVHLGWHYAIDGIASLGLVLLLWRVSAPVADWLERERSPRVGGFAPAG